MGILPGGIEFSDEELKHLSKAFANRMAFLMSPLRPESVKEFDLGKAEALPQLPITDAEAKAIGSLLPNRQDAKRAVEGKIRATNVIVLAKKAMANGEWLRRDKAGDVLFAWRLVAGKLKEGARIASLQQLAIVYHMVLDVLLPEGSNTYFEKRLMDMIGVDAATGAYLSSFLDRHDSPADTKQLQESEAQQEQQEQQQGQQQQRAVGPVLPPAPAPQLPPPASIAASLSLAASGVALQQKMASTTDIDDGLDEFEAVGAGEPATGDMLDMLESEAKSALGAGEQKASAAASRQASRRSSVAPAATHTDPALAAMQQQLAAAQQQLAKALEAKRKKDQNDRVAAEKAAMAAQLQQLQAQIAAVNAELARTAPTPQPQAYAPQQPSLQQLQSQQMAQQPQQQQQLQQQLAQQQLQQQQLAAQQQQTLQQQQFRFPQQGAGIASQQPPQQQWSLQQPQYLFQVQQPSFAGALFQAPLFTQGAFSSGPPGQQSAALFQPPAVVSGAGIFQGTQQAATPAAQQQQLMLPLLGKARRGGVDLAQQPVYSYLLQVASAAERDAKLEPAEHMRYAPRFLTDRIATHSDLSGWMRGKANTQQWLSKPAVLAKAQELAAEIDEILYAAGHDFSTLLSDVLEKKGRELMLLEATIMRPNTPREVLENSLRLDNRLPVSGNAGKHLDAAIATNLKEYNAVQSAQKQGKREFLNTPRHERGGKGKGKGKGGNAPKAESAKAEAKPGAGGAAAKSAGAAGSS
jgi:hypothetical protein